MGSGGRIDNQTEQLSGQKYTKSTTTSRQSTQSAGLPKSMVSYWLLVPLTERFQSSLMTLLPTSGTTRRCLTLTPSVAMLSAGLPSTPQDRRVVIWSKESDASTQWIQKELHSFEDVVWHVSWSVSGQFLAVSGGDNKVSLWKETLEGQWVCISDVSKGQGSALQGATSAQPQSVQG